MQKQKKLLTTCFCITCRSQDNCKHRNTHMETSTCGLLTDTIHHIMNGYPAAAIVRYHNICADDPLRIAEYLCHSKRYAPAAAEELEVTASYTPASVHASGYVSIYLAPASSIGTFIDLEYFFQEMIALGFPVLKKERADFLQHANESIVNYLYFFEFCIHMAQKDMCTFPPCIDILLYLFLLGIPLKQLQRIY